MENKEALSRTANGQCGLEMKQSASKYGSGRAVESQPKSRPLVWRAVSRGEPRQRQRLVDSFSLTHSNREGHSLFFLFSHGIPSHHRDRALVALEGRASAPVHRVGRLAAKLPHSGSMLERHTAVSALPRHHEHLFVCIPDSVSLQTRWALNSLHMYIHTHRHHPGNMGFA